LLPTHRLLPRLLAHVPCPLLLLVRQPQQQQQQQLSCQQQELLAVLLLRALQLHPRLCSQAWRGSLWCQLLAQQLQQQDQASATRSILVWCACQAVGLLLGLPDAVSSQLLGAHLSTQQRVQAQARCGLGGTQDCACMC
jgi:hypothetical protein